MRPAIPTRIAAPPIPPFADDVRHGGGSRTRALPCGLCAVAEGGEGAGAGFLRLAGGRFCFSHIDIITEYKSALTIARIPAPALADMAAGSGEAGAEMLAATCLENITRPRATFAGLDMAMPQIMGIINATPDSFSDGGQHADSASAVAAAKRMADDGAAILDIGGESTRPGADAISRDEEMARILPVITALAEEGYCISADTRHAPVMEAALESGAAIINDVGGLADEGAAEVIAEQGASAVVMHMQGAPQTMQNAPAYPHDFAPLAVFDFLEKRLAALEGAGIARNALAVDPGFGFGKTAAHNMQLMACLPLFHGLGVPVVLGASRKATIAKLSRGEPPQSRLPGSLALAVLAAGAGVQILRVHDVAATRQALALACATAMA